MKNTEAMVEAVRLSFEAINCGTGGPFGAVIVQDNHVVGRGKNSVLLLNDPTAHAEVMAIREACQTLKAFHLPDVQLYTSCEPCPMCLSACYWAHIKTIYYCNSRVDAARAEFDDAFIYEQLSKPIEARTISMQQVLHKEGPIAFERWKAQASKVKY